MHQCVVLMLQCTLLHQCVAPLFCTSVLHHFVALMCCTRLCFTNVLHKCVAPVCCTSVLHQCCNNDQTRAHRCGPYSITLGCHLANLSASPPCQGQEPTLSVQTGYIQPLGHSEWLCIITLDIMMLTRKQVKPVVKVYLPIPPLQPFDKVGCNTGLQMEPRSKSKCRFGLKSSPVKSS